jgi:hypothetical protein
MLLRRPTGRATARQEMLTPLTKRYILEVLFPRSLGGLTRALLALFAGLCLTGQAAAQMDFSGEWTAVPAQANVENPQIGEYAGLPMNDEALRRAEIWDPAIESLPVWQCRPQTGASIKLGPSALRISKLIDGSSRELVAFQAEWLRSGGVPIYLDGRPHPPAHAAHSWGGFSTGVWIGDMLKVTTTHLKEGYYRRNGVPQSDRAELTEYLIRRRFRGKDYLTWVVIANDPVYLTEPLVRSGEYRLDPARSLEPYPCALVKPVNGSDDLVPSYPPGANEQIHNFADGYGLPRRIVADGAATMYPEFRAVLAEGQTGTQAPAVGVVQP